MSAAQSIFYDLANSTGLAGQTQTSPFFIYLSEPNIGRLFLSKIRKLSFDLSELRSRKTQLLGQKLSSKVEKNSVLLHKIFTKLSFFSQKSVQKRKNSIFQKFQCRKCMTKKSLVLYYICFFFPGMCDGPRQDQERLPKRG